VIAPREAGTAQLQKSKEEEMDTKQGQRGEEFADLEGK